MQEAQIKTTTTQKFLPDTIKPILTFKIKTSNNVLLYKNQHNSMIYKIKKN